MIAALLACDAIASAQDALICRKRDKQAGPGGTVHRLGSGADFYNAGPGPDVVYGGPGDDIINGGRGNDRVYGGPGRDIVCGGVGQDFADGDAGDDEVFGEEGNDTVRGGPGRDFVQGQDGSNRIIGFGMRNGEPIADGRDWLEGFVRQDVIDVGGFDDAFGAGRQDVIRVRTPGLVPGHLDGGLSRDKIIGSERADHLYGGEGSNEIFGRGGDDWIQGGSQVDRIHGNRGDDTIFGVSGEDLIFGDLGDDRCFGVYDATFDTCERARADDAKEEAFARVDTAWDALRRVAAKRGWPVPVAALRRELRSLPEGSPEIRLDVVFVPTYEVVVEAYLEIEAINNPRITYLFVDKRRPRNEARTRINRTSYFLSVDLTAHPRCQGKHQTHHNDCVR